MESNNTYVISQPQLFYNYGKNHSNLLVKSQINSLTINGSDNNITFQNEILNLIINGENNKINASHRKCLLTNIVFNGSKNKVEVNQRSEGVCIIHNASHNKVYNREHQNINNSSHRQNNTNTFNFGNSNISINFNNGHSNANINPNQIFDIINSVTNQMNMSIQIPGLNFNGRQNQNFNQDAEENNEVYEDDDEEEEEEYEEGEDEETLFFKKRDKFILELDEFQYKHISKFTALNEEKCAICLVKYKGTDIIKEFPCKHIFHKDCIMKWLKKSNCCPLCKHDFSKEISNVQLSPENSGEEEA